MFLPNNIYCYDFYNAVYDLPEAKLVLADPVYDDYLFYREIFKIKAENYFMFTNGKHLIPCSKAVPELDEARVLTVHKQTHGNLSGSAIEKAYHVYWAGSQRTIDQKHKIPDSWISNSWDKKWPTTHKWTKNPDYIALLIKGTTKPGDLIIDPCCGDGLTPYIAKILNRRYIGIEIGGVSVQSL